MIYFKKLLVMNKFQKSLILAVIVIFQCVGFNILIVVDILLFGKNLSFSQIFESRSKLQTKRILELGLIE